ncbi:MAE_28990/MAE_18760 family HEPN-like nuclease [Bifidobacterium sp. B4079]|uniref:MAE_28990/MAE_18760 family HEPN-like nuclease n=1 Tax=Bifidobacterium sp. B4079 TaxID=2817960 RepID=UPI00226B1061|nr:MAE_28990/MAE_18760 family HEPN-like nuclease [Bifidobacterium sp. B4079]
MSNLADTLLQLKQRSQEIYDLLSLPHALSVSPETDRALRKSTFMMLCAYFEGDFFEALRAIIHDINEDNRWNALPHELKIATLQYSYLQNLPHSDKKQVNKNLVEKISKNFLDKLVKQGIQLQVEEDFLDAKSGLTPKNVSQFCEDFGVKNFLNSLYSSEYEVVFEGEFASSRLMIKRKFSTLYSDTSRFPYNIRLTDTEGTVTDHSITGQSLFDDFLTNLSQKRNQVMHGSMDDDSVPLEHDIEDNLIKVEAFTLAVIDKIAAQFSDSSK